MSSFRKPKDRDGFKIAIICALTLERDAVMEMLDETWETVEYRKVPEDVNTYKVGRVGSHNVVVTQLPGMGTQEAASASASIRLSFRNIILGLVVGVCGGVPTKTESGNILLGDVIISKSIVDFTFGRQYDNHFTIKDTLENQFGRPNKEIRGFLETMQGKHDRAKLKAASSMYLVELCQKVGFESSRSPGNDKDIVYPRGYRHKHQQIGSCTSCVTCKLAEDELEEAQADGKPQDELRRLEAKVRGAATCAESEKMSCDELRCDVDKGVLRNSRERIHIEGITMRAPEIHFGVIGSGNSILRSGYIRDELAEEKEIIAFEMEGAGVWDNFPTVVIKAVCDYADGHKSKLWQKYAAASAAACMKAFLMEWPTTNALPPNIAEPKISQRFPFPRNDDFVVRESLFTALESLLPSTSPLRSAVLWGLGGSGKTQIALEFAYQRHFTKHCIVFWVHASSYEKFLQGYCQIATDAGLSSDLQGFKLLAAVRSWLESQADWLLILDNTDDLSLFGLRDSVGETDTCTNLMAFIPCGSRGNILWTTRDKRAVGHLVGTSRGINVEDMTDDEAMEMLTGLSGKPETTQNAGSVSEILAHLERLPLAISQAAAFIRARDISYHDYLKRLCQERTRWRILAEDGPNRHRLDGVPHNVMQTWQITVDHLRHAHPLAHWILMVVAYFHNQDIAWSLLKIVGSQGLRKERVQHLLTVDGRAALSVDDDSDAEEDETRSALSRLTQFSLLRAQFNDSHELRSYNIHKLVQDATRRTVWSASVRTTQSLSWNAAVTALRAISQVFPSGEYGTWSDCARLLAHVFIIRQWPDVEGLEIRKYDVFGRASYYLSEQGRWSEAEEIYNEQLALGEKVYGDEHLKIACDMFNLATTYRQQGRLSEAEKIYQHVLELRKESLGDKHPRTVSSMAGLAWTYHRQGRLSEAEEIYLRVLDLERDLLGDKHPDTLGHIGNLGAIYRDQGRLSEAEDIYRHVLDTQEELLGDKHPSRIKSILGLAAIYLEQGRLSEAEKIYQDVLKLQKEVSGDKYPSTIRCMSSLATTYYRQGRLEEAEAMAQQVLELRAEVLGEKHPATIRSLNKVKRYHAKQTDLSDGASLTVQPASRA